MREQQWLGEKWHRLCLICGSDWLDSTSVALADGKDADHSVGKRTVTTSWWTQRLHICFYLPPEEIDSISFLLCGLREGRLGTSRGSSPAGRMLDIGLLSAMWARWGLLDLDSTQWHRRPLAGGPAKAGSHSASNLSLTLKSRRETDTSSGHKGLFLIFFSVAVRYVTHKSRLKCIAVIKMLHSLGIPL